MKSFARNFIRWDIVYRSTEHKNEDKSIVDASVLDEGKNWRDGLQNCKQNLRLMKNSPRKQPGEITRFVQAESAFKSLFDHTLDLFIVFHYFFALFSPESKNDSMSLSSLTFSPSSL